MGSNDLRGMLRGTSAMRLFVAALVAMGLAGCAGSAKKTPSSAFFAAHLGKVAEERAGVIADACVIRDEVGSDYILRAESAERGQRTGEAIGDFLRTLGYEPTVVTTPLICGAVGDGALGTLRIAEAKGQDEQELDALPVVLDASLAADAELVAAYRAVLTAVGAVPVSLTGKNGEDPAAVAIEIGALDQTALREHLGVRHAWLLQYTRLDVSGGKSFGMAMLTGVASVAMTGGAFLATSFPVGGEAYTVALLDLDGPSVLWKQVVPGPALNAALRRAKAEPYGQIWAARLLDPMLSAGSP